MFGGRWLGTESRDIPFDVSVSAVQAGDSSGVLVVIQRGAHSMGTATETIGARLRKPLSILRVALRDSSSSSDPIGQISSRLFSTLNIAMSSTHSPISHVGRSLLSTLSGIHNEFLHMSHSLSGLEE